MGRYSMLSTAVLLAFSFNVAGSTDDNDSDYIMSISLEDLLNIEVEVATKSKKSLSDSPSTVSVFTHQEIDALGIETLQELLNLVPGFQTQAIGDHGTAKIATARGRRASNTGFEILVLYDGQRLNSEWSGSALQTNSKMSLKNVKQVEIIRGPGSAIYGSTLLLVLSI